jgi:hypothetical protein
LRAREGETFTLIFLDREEARLMLMLLELFMLVFLELRAPFTLIRFELEFRGRDLPRVIVRPRGGAALRRFGRASASRIFM